MSDLSAALNTASGALQAFSTALNVTQNNVSNSQTPGYVTQIPTYDALSFQLQQGLPGGVQAGTPQDTRNEYAEIAVRQQATLLGASQQLATSLAPIEQAISVSGTNSISSALDALSQSFSAWSANPNDVSTQAAVISAAGAVAAAFQQGASTLSQTEQSVNGDLQTTITSINGLASQIQQLNVAQQRESGPDPGLQAQTNAALEQLAQYGDVQVLPASDGTISVLLDGQVPLVVGDQVDKLSLTYSTPAGAVNPSAPPNAAVVDQNGTDYTQNISDGQLGALLSVRNQVLPQLIGGPSGDGDLNTLAKQVADAVNSVSTAAGGPALFTYNSTSPVLTAGTIAVASGLQPGNLVTADPGPPPVSNGVPLNLANLANQTFTGLQGMTFDQFYGSTASSIGTQLNQAQTASQAQSQTLAQAQALRQQLSGVSLDAEATRLMQLQQSYEAASRMVTVLDGLTQNLISLFPTT